MDVFEIPEDIDLVADQGELDLLRGDLAVLDRYYADIAKVGAVSRAQAQTLVRDCGVQFGDSYPLNSFTEQPSAVNISVTMEGLASSVARTLWSMIKKAAALLMKVARWIMDLMRRGLGLSKDVNKALAATGAMHEVSTRMENMVASIGDTPAIYHAKQTLQQVSADYDSNFNDLIYDMLTDETFTTAVRYVGMDLLQFHEVIEMKLQMYRNLVRSAEANQNNVAANTSLIGQLRTIAEPISGDRIRGYLKNAGVDVQKPTLNDAITALRQTQANMRQSRTCSHISPEDATNRLINACEGFAAPFITDMDNWHRVMDRLSRMLNDLSHAEPAGMVSEEAMRAYAIAFNVIEKEIQALRTFVVTAESCRTVRDNLIHDVFEVAKADIQVLQAKVDAAGDANIKAQFTKELQHVATVSRAA